MANYQQQQIDYQEITPTFSLKLSQGNIAKKILNQALLGYMTNLSSKENEQIGNNRLKGLSFFLYNNVLQKTLLLNTLLIAKNDKEIQEKKRQNKRIQHERYSNTKIKAKCSFQTLHILDQARKIAITEPLCALSVVYYHGLGILSLCKGNFKACMKSNLLNSCGKIMRFTTILQIYLPERSIYTFNSLD